MHARKHCRALAVIDTMKLRLPIAFALALGLTACGGSGVNFAFSGFDSLTTGDSFANGRYYDVWTFQADRSRRFTFGMNSFDFLPHLEVEDDFGNIIADDPHAGGEADVEISVNLQQGEIYHVIATSAFPDELGDYELLWENDAFYMERNKPSTLQKVKLKSMPKDAATKPQSRQSAFDPTRAKAKAGAGSAASTRE